MKRILVLVVAAACGVLSASAEVKGSYAHGVSGGGTVLLVR